MASHFSGQLLRGRLWIRRARYTKRVQVHAELQNRAGLRLAYVIRSGFPPGSQENYRSRRDSDHCLFCRNCDD